MSASSAVGKIKILIQLPLEQDRFVLVLQRRRMPVFRIPEKSLSTVINRMIIVNQIIFKYENRYSFVFQKVLSVPAPNCRHSESENKGNTCPTFKGEVSRWKITNKSVLEGDHHKGKKNQRKSILGVMTHVTASGWKCSVVCNSAQIHVLLSVSEFWYE